MPAKFYMRCVSLHNLPTVITEIRHAVDSEGRFGPPPVTREQASRAVATWARYNQEWTYSLYSRQDPPRPRAIHPEL